MVKKCMIKIQHVSKVFDSRGIAGLHAVNLTIPKNHVFALMGPNGSGKSTLLNIIAGTIKSDTGSIEASGKIQALILECPDAEMNVQKFLISQVSTSVDEDKKVQLTRDMASIFEFTFQLRQKIGELSQGQLQKVLMSANLINNPEILLLDEPFVHLDPMTRKDILLSLFEYIRQREMTVIWVTHEEEEAFQFADSIALIQHGKIEQLGSAYDLLAHPKNIFVASFFGHQNLVQIKSLDGIWKTPWGDLSNKTNLIEAYLLVPPNAWIEADSDEYIINSVKAKFHYAELIVSKNDRDFMVHLPLSNFEQYKKRANIGLTVKLNECSLVNL